MHIFPIRTRIIHGGDDLGAMLTEAHLIEPGDIIVVSSKAAATAEGAGYDLASLEISDEARRWSAEMHMDASFAEAVVRETHKMHGRICGGCPGVLLTDVRPDGLAHGSILAANAGLDRSNVPNGRAIGWPENVAETVRRLHAALGTAIILSDSCCTPRRSGVTAYALAASGFDPLVNRIGETDLFGRALRMTVEAVGDQLAVAANAVMGNTDQAFPAAIIRDHGIQTSNFEGWVPGIEAKEDLFRELL